MSTKTLLDVLGPEADGGRIVGVVTAVVTDNRDAEGLGRVKVRFPWLSDTDESAWARVAAPMAGDERGAYFLPDVDDEVLVAFHHGHPSYPYVVGSLWSANVRPPESNDDGKNAKRTIKSRSGHVVRLDDTEGEAKIEIVDGSGKNRVVVSTNENTITIAAEGDVTITSSSGKLSLRGNGIQLESQAGVTIEASESVDLKAAGELNVKGELVNIN